MSAKWHELEECHRENVIRCLKYKLENCDNVCDTVLSNYKPELADAYRAAIEVLEREVERQAKEAAKEKVFKVFCSPTCERCAGSCWSFTSDDGGYYEPCPDCKGTGRRAC